MRYNEPVTLTFKVELVRRPGIHLATVTSDHTGELQAQSNTTTEQTGQIPDVVAEAVQQLLGEALGQYKKLLELSNIIDLKPEARALFEHLTVIFAKEKSS